MADNDNRLEALRFAHSNDSAAEDVVRRANQYLAFLEGAAPEPKVVTRSDAPAEAKAAKAAAKVATPPPAEEPPAEESEFSINEVRAALKAYREIEGSTAMLEILKTHGGAESLATIEPSKYGAIMEAVTAK